jgi:glycolate oxidase FAD binding subunit
MTKSSPSLAAALERMLGASHVLSDALACAPYTVDEIIPSAMVKPADAEATAEIVRFASLEKLTLIPCGNRTKLSVGMSPVRYDIALDMTALNQIAHYDPGDLTLSVDAGISLAKLNAALFAHQQFLPLLVPWYSRATIAGTIASGLHSPLQQFYGTARDFLIGAEFIDGTGKLCRSGGRVVKNVTGYDLHKLLIGSLGSLAVITRLNFRTFPAPLAGSRGFVASFSNAEGALALRRAIAESSLTPLTHDIVSPELAQIFATRTPSAPEPAVFAGEDRTAAQGSLPPIGNWFNPHGWHLCAAFAGTPEVLDRYASELTLLAERSRATSTTFLDDATRPAFWRRLRETLSMLLEISPAAVIYKIRALPSHHAALFSDLRQIADRAQLSHALVARAGGTIYFALLPASISDETTLRISNFADELFHSISPVVDPAHTHRVHAALLFAPPTWKRSLHIPDGGEGQTLDLWGPPPRDLALMHRLKNAFDPQNILAPGRVI